MLREIKKKKMVLGWVIFIVVILSIILLYNTSGKIEYQTSTVLVIDKAVADNQIIIVQEVYDDKEFQIKIADENVWNLVQEGQVYFVVFSTDGKNKRNLLQIEVME